MTLDAGAGGITNGTLGLLKSDSIALSAALGIGSAKGAVRTEGESTNVTVRANSTGGIVNISNTVAYGINIDTSSSRGAFTVKDSSGTLNVVGDITVGDPGDVVAKKTTNNLSLIELNTTSAATIDIIGSLDVTGGGIVIQNMNTSGNIVFGSGITVDTLVNKNTSATAGNITIAIGALPKSGITMSDTAGYTVTTTPPGTVTQTIDNLVTGTGAQLNAAGRSIRFGGTVEGSIDLSDAIITADPPGYATVSGGGVSGGSGGVSGGSGGSTGGTMTITNTIESSKTKYAFPGDIMPSVTGGRSSEVQSTRLISSDVTIIGGSSSGNLMIAPTTGPNSDSSTPPSSPYQPIAFVSGAASAFTARQPEGMSILAPTCDASIETPMGTLKIKAGAVVLAVIQANGTVSVYNLHDNGTGDVALKAAGETTTIVPGSHITVTPGTVREFGDVNAIECISHRDVRVAHKDTATLFTSDFSITSALKELPTLVEMRKSNDPAARRVAADILKTAAILMQLGSSRGAYQRVTPKSRITAMQ